MTHDFTGKSIKCDTWEQMLHLAKLAEEQGYEICRKDYFLQSDFIKGYVYFTLTTDLKKYVIVPGIAYNEKQVTYSDFINTTLPTEVVEVTGCGDCPIYLGLVCLHPKQLFKRNHFITCPLKKHL